MKKILCAMILIGICVSLVGCGETFRGIGKDTQRMGKGVKTIFIRED